MSSSPKSSAGGYWMLFALVVMLALPMAIGHYTMKTDADVTHHAAASVQ